MWRRSVLWATLMVVLTGAAPASGIVLKEDELAGTSTELGILLRVFGFSFFGPILEPPLSPVDQNPSGSAINDLRVSFQHKTNRFKIVLHNQLTLRLNSHAASTAVVLGRGIAPARWLPLQFDAVDRPTIGLRDTIDWIYFSVTLGPVSLTIGRQPITFGRAKLWPVTDLISTFSITEVDTEYKPGSDAFRLDWQIAAKSLLTIVAVAGEHEDDLDARATLRGSSFAARFKQGWKNGEIGILGGFIRRDVVFGLDLAQDLGKFDIHAEVVTTLILEKSLTFSGSRTKNPKKIVVRGVIGATIKPVSKLTIVTEFYYNGLGGKSASDYLDVALSERMRAGDFYNLGRYYLGAMVIWEVHPLVTLNTVVMGNLRDPSALFSVGLSYNVASNVNLIFGGYFPLGKRPVASTLVPEPKSEFGLYPYFVFLELKVAI